MSSPAQNDKTPLPLLRTDLHVEVVSERGRSLPSVIVSDPIRSTYYRFSWPKSAIILHWSAAATVEQLIDLIAHQYGSSLERDDVIAVAEFASLNQLTDSRQAGGWQRYAAAASSGRKSWYQLLIHNYLFFRIPLIRPEPLLRTVHPRLAFLMRSRFWILLLVAAVIGLYLVSRQWAAFVSAGRDALRFEGLVIYSVAILCLKAAHEMGHALATFHFGCRVPSMGVAVMLGAPVFYTDTTDSWRLSRRSERLKIVFAGVAAEAIIAVAAIFMWVILPDGTARQVCFALATATIVISLAVNLNPLMRFDGYYALSDFLEVPNLQSRAFAVMTWRLREVLFGLGHAPPENLRPARQRVLLIYGVATAIYRFVLFLAIALFVYTVSGKLLGFVLGAIEIGVFIAVPIFRECAEWWNLRSEIVASTRFRWTVGGAALISIVLFAPWLTRTEGVAVLTAANEEAVYLPFPAMLTSVSIKNGQLVNANELLFRARSPEIEQQHLKTTIEKASLEIQVARLHASDRERELRGVTESRLTQAVEKAQSIDRRFRQLEVRAPFSGKIVDLDPDLSNDLWLDQKRPIARIIAVTGARIKALVPGSEIERIAVGARAKFIPDDPAEPSTAAYVVSIAPATDGRLSEHSLADRYGGDVAVGEVGGDLKLRHSWYELDLSTDQGVPTRLLRGVVHVSTDGVSPMKLIWRQVLRIVVREQGF